MSKRVVQSRLWVPPVLSTEALVVLTSIYIVVFGNLPWWQGALAARSWAEAGTWLFAACVGIALAALQYMLLVLIATRRTVKLWLTLVLIATGVTSYYMRSYAALLDPTMMRNVLRTDAREVGDLLSWSLIWQTLAFVLPAAVFVWWAELRIWSWGRAAGQRALTLVAALVLAVLALLAVNRDFTSLMRNERELRYRITPANLIYSTARNLFSDARTSVKPRVLVGNDARVGPRVAAAARPVAFVLVVGETGRAANFSLNGYARQTNPELAKRNVVAFQDVTACGTSTEVSLPCMFSPYGRADYDEELIRRSDGLLQIVARTDIKVLWRENQSGCKGVCDGAGIDARNVDPQLAPALCRGTECLDGILVEELKAALAAPGGSRLIVLHEMGSHGPAYYERYPPRLRRFTPTCDSPELRRCTPEEVVNTYDNGILYTDEVLAQSIDVLRQHSERFDTVLLYVSDHGESLGERGLYLHGIPYAIAPDVQLKVPLIYWMSAEFASAGQLDPACVRARALEPASHDNLFHSVLALLDVKTSAYQRGRDFFADCRKS